MDNILITKSEKVLLIESISYKYESQTNKYSYMIYNNDKIIAMCDVFVRYYIDSGSKIIYNINTNVKTNFVSFAPDDWEIVCNTIIVNNTVKVIFNFYKQVHYLSNKQFFKSITKNIE